MKLIFARKPSIAQSITAAISATGYVQGSGYIVSWCVGHLAGLADVATHGTSFAK